MSKDMTAKQEWQKRGRHRQGEGREVLIAAHLPVHCWNRLGTVAASALTGIEVPLAWCSTSSGTSNNWPPYYGSYGTQGRLIAETDAGGALKRELIWLGDIPVGVVQ